MKHLNKFNEAGPVSNEVTVLLEDMMNYKKAEIEKTLRYYSRCEANFLDFYNDFVKEMKRKFGKNYKVWIEKYKGSSYHVELQKYMFTIHCDKYFIDPTGKKYYAVQENDAKTITDKYGIELYEFYQSFNDSYFHTSIFYTEK